MGAVAYRLRNAEIEREQDVLDELRARTAQRGNAKNIAADAGCGLPALYETRAGRRHMTPSLASELGFTLAWVRMEELDLLAKLESELRQPDRYKEGE